MIKKLTSYLFLLLMLAGCSDEISWDKGSVLNPDGSVDFMLSVPEMTVVTRTGNEPSSAVETMRLLVFDGTSAESVLKYNTELEFGDGLLSGDQEKGQYMVHIDLSASLISQGNLGFYFIANPPEDMNITDDDIDRLKLGEIQNKRAKILSVNNEFVLSGKYVGSLGNLKGTTVQLNRNAVKVTVNAMVREGNDYKRDENGNYVLGDAIYPFDVYGCAASTSIVAGADGTTGAARAIQEFPFDGNSEAEYVNPTTNSGSLPIVIVKANYATDGKDYYYALAMKKKVTENQVEKIIPINYEPNHWYQILIKEIKAPGANSPEEAALNPIMSSEDEDGLITWKIHDHSPNVYNMVSDGTCELGVSHQVVYHLGPNADGEWSNFYFYVKVYDNDNKSLSFSGLKGDNAITIEESEDWLEIDSPVDASDDPVESSYTGTEGSTVGGGVPAGDNAANSRGVVLKYRLRFKGTNRLGTLETKVKVNWRGLLREVPITWMRDFNGSDLCDITMRMYDESDVKKFETAKYWNLLKGEEAGGVSFFGIDQEHNGDACRGMVRFEGLHFPVMYGRTSASKAWRYEYDILFSSLKNQGFKWFITLHGDPVLKNYVEISLYDGNSASRNTAVDVETAKTKATGQDLKLLVKRVGKVSNSDYDYGTGYLRLHIVDPSTNEESDYYDLDLYHTGFFHKNTAVSQINRKDTDGDGYNDINNWYYYEVVPVDGPSGKRYMLDRNLGSKTAEFYLSNGGTRIAGPDKAPGGYYRVATKMANYGGTQMIDGICPPGYDYPSQAAWDAIRNSSSYKYERVDAFYKPVYIAGNAGTINFPKMEYKDGGVWSGQSLSGYYWSSTMASGLEKDEIGRWLRALCFSGSSTSYINSNVEDFEMPVRCINYMDESTLPTYETTINVAGATHVYLYTIEDGKPVGMTAWPGQAVGNYSTMDGCNNWFQYNFQSKTVRPQDLYVVFNFLNSDGTIYTYAKNGKGYTLTDVEGWKVVGDDDSRIKDTTSGMEDWIGVPTRNNYYWQWKHTSASGLSSAPLYCYNYEPGKANRKYRIYWQKSLNDSWIYIFTYNSGNHSDHSHINTFGSGYGKASEEYGDYMYYDFSDGNVSKPEWPFGFCFVGSGDKYPDKYIRDVFTLQANGRYCAYIDENNVNYPKAGLPPVTPTNNKFRILWPLTGSYNQIQIKSGNDIVSDYTSVSNTMLYDGISCYYYDVTLTNSSVSFRFKNSAGTEMTPDPDNAYTLSNYTTEVEGRRIVQIQSLKAAPVSTKRKFRIYWQNADDRRALHIWNNTDFTNWDNGADNAKVASDLNGFVCIEFEAEPANYSNDSGNFKMKFKNQNGGQEFDSGKTVEELFTDKVGDYYCAYFIYNDQKPVAFLSSRPSAITANYRRVYCENNSNWSFVKIHHWGGSSDGTNWPGDMMTQIGSTKYWYKDIPNDRTGIKVNNESSSNGSGGKEYKDNNFKKYQEVYSSN